MRCMMIRKQIYIEERQERLLKRQARSLGKTEAELIRLAIDRSLGTGGGVVSDEAWQRAYATMRKRLGPPGEGSPRTWSRDDVHDR